MYIQYSAMCHFLSTASVGCLINMYSMCTNIRQCVEMEAFGGRLSCLALVAVVPLGLLQCLQPRVAGQAVCTQTHTHTHTHTHLVHMYMYYRMARNFQNFVDYPSPLSAQNFSKNFCRWWKNFTRKSSQLYYGSAVLVYYITYVRM